MAGNAGGQNSDDAKAFAKGQGGGDGTFRYTHYRPRGGLPRRMQTGVGETGDHESIGAVVFPFDQAAKGPNHAIHVALGLDARWPSS